MQIDNSDRKNLRFLPAAENSDFDQLVKKFGYQRQDNEKFKWTTSQRALLFEIRPDRKDTDNIKWTLHVMVGPLSVPDREDFLDFLRSAIKKDSDQISPDVAERTIAMTLQIRPSSGEGGLPRYVRQLEIAAWMRENDRDSENGRQSMTCAGFFFRANND